MSLTERLHGAVRAGAEVQRRFSAIRGGNLAAAISMRAFLALFPIAILAIGVIGLAGGDPSTVSRNLAHALGLGQDVGHTIGHSVQTAEGARLTSSIVGIVGLLWTGTGLSAAMSAAWDSAWDTPGGSLRGRALGAIWLVGGLAFLAATVGLGVLLHQANVLLELGVLGGVLSSALFLFWTALLLPSRRIPWRDMVWPAVLGGIALELLRDIGSTIVPALVRRSSTAYGAIGATFAMLVWLLFMGRVVVYVAVYERARLDARVTG